MSNLTSRATGTGGRSALPVVEEQDNNLVNEGLGKGDSPFFLVDVSAKPRSTRRFYEKQNALVESLQKLRVLKSPENTSTAAERGTTSHILTTAAAEDEGIEMVLSDIKVNDTDQKDGEGEPESSSSDNNILRSAIIASFASNVLLLLMKGWLAFSTGSIAIIASAADSFLDLLSGVVLLVTQRLAHHNVDLQKYPEGRARVEPIGVIVFATVMCFSSLNILIESMRRLVDGFGSSGPREIDVALAGFVVLITTILVKVALFFYCRAALFSVASEGSGNNEGAAAVAAYAQDHMNDVLTNAVAVGCVLLASSRSLAEQGWWVADSLGAAAISLWIMYSWAEVGSDHIEQLSGKVADKAFLQQLTFIAANSDQRVKHVDTVRAWHFGARVLVELHIVLDPLMPLRDAHDIGEALEVAVERLGEVERCFVHLDTEFDHEPEYKRRVR